MTKALSLALAASLFLLVVDGCKKKDDSAASGGGGGGEGGAASASGASGASGGSTLAGGFEGSLTMHVTSARHQEDITFFAKGDKLRFDAPGRPGEAPTHIIFVTGSKKVDVIVDQQHTYIEMDLPQVQAQAAAAGAPSAQASVSKTGKHETVAGYDCEDWEIKEPSGKHSQACIAEGIPFIDFSSVGPGALANPNANTWMHEFHDKKLFPLRVIEFDAQNKEASRMEVTSIEKKKLDDALFTIPPGFNKMALPHFRPGGFPR
jgi:hypothetical protein